MRYLGSKEANSRLAKRAYRPDTPKQPAISADTVPGYARAVVAQIGGRTGTLPIFTALVFGTYAHPQVLRGHSLSRRLHALRRMSSSN